MVAKIVVIVVLILVLLAVGIGGWYAWKQGMFDSSTSSNTKPKKTCPPCTACPTCPTCPTGPVCDTTACNNWMLGSIQGMVMDNDRIPQWDNASATACKNCPNRKGVWLIPGQLVQLDNTFPWSACGPGKPNDCYSTVML